MDELLLRLVNNQLLSLSLNKVGRKSKSRRADGNQQQPPLLPGQPLQPQPGQQPQQQNQLAQQQQQAADLQRLPAPPSQPPPAVGLDDDDEAGLGLPPADPSAAGSSSSPSSSSDSQIVTVDVRGHKQQHAPDALLDAYQSELEHGLSRSTLYRQLLLGLGAAQTSLTSLTLSHNNLDGGSMVGLGSALAANRSLTSLCVANNKIGSEGAKALCDALRINSSLTSLDVSSNALMDEGGDAIAELLLHSKHLTSLDLSHCSIYNAGCKALISALRHNHALRHLHLTKNYALVDGAAAMGEVLAVNRSLLRLDLTSNYIYAEGCKELSKGLAVNRTLQELHLAGNEISNAGVKALSSALKLNSSLQILLIHDNLISHVGAKDLASALKKNCSLTLLHLCDNQIGTKGAEIIAKALKANRTLQRLHLAANDINAQGIRALAKALKTGGGGGGGMGGGSAGGGSGGGGGGGGSGGSGGGGGSSSSGSSSSSVLSELNLSWNRFGPEGAKYVGQLLKDNATLKELSIAHNKMFDEGLCSVMELGVRFNSTLELLDVSHNRVRLKGMEVTAQLLPSNSSLLSLNIEQSQQQQLGVIFEVRRDYVKEEAAIAAVLRRNLVRHVQRCKLSVMLAMHGRVGAGSVMQAVFRSSPIGDVSVMREVWEFCFPESDTRVLTDTGFLFLSEIEDRIVHKERVLYACYDIRTASIVYRPGKLVTDAPDPVRWVDFTQAATRRLWDATSDDYGDAGPGEGRLHHVDRLSIRTTPDHEMYVQVGRRLGDADQCFRERRRDSAPAPPHKMRAEELAPGFVCSCANKKECAHGYSVYRMLTGASAGISHADIMSVRDTTLESPVVCLRLRSDDQLNAFLELYGYWLGDGSMHYTLAAAPTLRFSPKKDLDWPYVRGLVRRLKLKSTEWSESAVGADGCLHVSITARRWGRYFDKEYGIKYEGSQRYNRAAAIAKLGNAPRRPLSAASTQSATPPAVSAATAASPGSRCSSSSSSSSARRSPLSLSAATTEPATPWSASVSSSYTGSYTGSYSSRSRTPSSADVDMELAPTTAISSTTRSSCSSDFTSLFADLSMETVVKSESDESELDEPVKDEDTPSSDDEDEEEEEEPDEPDEDEPGVPYEPDEDEETPAKSCKWFWGWVLTRLSKEQLRLVIEGLRQADVAALTKRQEAAGSDFSGKRRICTSSVAFRDALVQAFLHAGYSAHFSINTRAGSVRGWKERPTSYRIYSQEEVKQLQREQPSRDFYPVRAKYDNWWVNFSLSTTALLPAADVRYDGKALRLRAKEERGTGYVAVHSDGAVHVRDTQRELGDATDMQEATVRKWLSRPGQSTAGGWQLFTATAYAERSGGSGSSSSTSPAATSAASAATGKAKARSELDGRTWCVNVQHRDHLILVQRAHQNGDGIVTKASRPVVVGNCFGLKGDGSAGYQPFNPYSHMANHDPRAAR